MSRQKTKIGVLALQGAVSEHLQQLRRAGVEAVEVRQPAHLESLDGLIVPGGESTTIGKLLDRFGMLEAIAEAHRRGLAVWGTCAGMILLASRLSNGVAGQQTMGLMDLEVERNAFGRQLDSCEQHLQVDCLGEKPFPAVFIRAPRVVAHGPQVQVLARIADSIVAVRQGRLLATSFHPELTGDPRFHRYFVELAGPRPATAVVGANRNGPP